ncbi:RND transporter, Hydrophobe/Amphiphile Efflux-1 (HAE1)/Heavy Metal Efflux (HME) family, permease protein [Leptospira ryugenii]|uniref:RND transporter, Hydrophobe/Amphiphile Efflux-1 (HAE1)/Heavy Metal Efflux (HME) family, permease protein n=2 Tax=Leptospira ryugenii TaxID=1917863 RepID=A0A2P2E5E2_9LEPT|nr:RND transporter, Hydrophobe/Amphiphile Efflux-1 (HAE1)/Heavy Metal Efflux (HME) family, permease protein [Leptospira ryugenii]
MVYAGFCLFGAISIRDIPLSLLPNIDFPQLTIVTAFANSSPEEVENIISKPIAQMTGTIQGVEKVESISREGFSFVNLRFKTGTEMSYALLEVREKLDLIRDLLPTDASKPLISKFDPSKRAFMEIVFSPKGLGDQKKLRSFLRESVKLYFERIDGVALVEISGGFEKEILVEIDPNRMSAYKIQPADLRYLISVNNKNYPAGQLPFGNKELPVRMLGEFTSSLELGNLIIRGDENGANTRLADFSNIIEQYKDRKGFAKFNGEEAVILSLYREPGKNTVKLAKDVSVVLDQVNEAFGGEIQGVTSYDESIFIKESLNGLYMNLILGAILAYIALLIILKNYQSPTILLCAIPVTLLPSFLVFRYLGIGFNMMSLGGLALGIGMLFDSSNVVLSAIERNLPRFKKLEDAIYTGTLEVFSSIFSATATTIIVFLPIGFIKSTLGMIFREMALSIVITLSFSLLIAITFIPLTASFLYRFRKEGSSRNPFFYLYNEEALVSLYHKMLGQVMDARFTFFFFLFALFAFSVSLVPFIEKEYMPKIDTGEISVKVTLPQGSSLDTISQYVQYMEDTIKGNKNIRSVISKVGGEEEALRLNPNANTEPNRAELTILLGDEGNVTSESLIKSLREQFPKREGVDISFESKDNILGELLSGKREEVEYHILGDDLQELQEVGKSLKLRLQTNQGITSIKLGTENKTKEYQINYDQIKMAKYGFTNANVSTYVKIALKGLVSSEIQSGGVGLPIRLSMKKQSSDSIDKIKQLTILAPNGENVYLDQFVNFKIKDTEADIYRIGNQRVNEINIGIDESFRNIKREIDTIIKNFKRNSNIQIRPSGEKEKLDESLQEVFAAFLLAILLIFMLLSGQFESYRISFVMLSTIPLIFIGTFPALIISGKSLNISSFMGFILLMGVVVDNASLYYEYFHLFLDELKDPEKALYQATKTVLRPILMNNSTTILGMLPIVLALSKGSEFQAPLGIVVVFGLLTSVLLSLFVIPILFYILERRKVN